MTPLKARRFWRNRQRYAVGILVCICVLGLVPSAGGKPDQVDKLIGQLKDKHAKVRQNAASALSGIKDPRAVEPLIAALKDTDSLVRLLAAGALGEIGKPAVEPLIAALKDTDYLVRDAAAYALGQIKDPRAVEPLIAALKDRDANVRPSAARALGQIKDPRAVGPLITALKDTDANVRQNAARALAQIKDTRAVEALIAALKDTDANVRENAALKLGEINDPRAVEPLIAALKDTNATVELNAAAALGKINDPRAVEALSQQADTQMTAPTAILSGGGVCYLDKRDIVCKRTNGLVDLTPRLRLVDGLGPKDFGKRMGPTGSFNSSWDGGFKVSITAGPHTLTVSFFQSKRSSSGYYTSPDENVAFVAVSGHSYVVDSLIIAEGKWTPIVSDLTDKAHPYLVSEKH